MKRLNVDLDDFTNAALKRIVKQLLATPDGEEAKILDQLTRGHSKGSAEKEQNDLADLVEEKRGKPKSISPDGDLAADEPDGDDDDARFRSKKKKGKS